MGGGPLDVGCAPCVRQPRCCCAHRARLCHRPRPRAVVHRGSMYRWGFRNRGVLANATGSDNWCAPKLAHPQNRLPVSVRRAPASMRASGPLIPISAARAWKDGSSHTRVAKGPCGPWLSPRNCCPPARLARFVTRVFFGCLGPAHTAPPQLGVAASDTSLELASGISSAPLPDGSVVETCEGLRRACELCFRTGGTGGASGLVHMRARCSMRTRKSTNSLTPKSRCVALQCQLGHHMVRWWVLRAAGSPAAQATHPPGNGCTAPHMSTGPA